MIDVEDISKLVGKRVVSDTSGVLGTIIEIREDSNPIKVIFDNGNEVTYDKTGCYRTTTIPYYISLVDSEIASIISSTMATFRISPEELIAIILESHC
jgi:hypothetical protein